MAFFDDVRLPIYVERGASGGPRFKTRVLELESGFEQRNVDWENSKGEWDVGYGIMLLEDDGVALLHVQAVMNLFYAMNGRANGFRFKDWSDFKIGDKDDPVASNQIIGFGNGSTTVFQVHKRYSFGSALHDRVIKKLVVGTVSVLLEGVVQVGGVTVDANAGTVTFTTPPAATGGSGPGGAEVVSIACEFDVPVRFADDHLAVNVHVFSAASVPQIPLIELRLT
jgi:uncharacterized protein (TIGR02217 family)